MKEEPIFWVGGNSAYHGKNQVSPDTAALEPAIRGACREAGIEPREFVAALGDYGSWLVNFARGRTRERIVWNGRERRLVLQSAIPSGGWSDRHQLDLDAATAPDFTAAIATLLRDPAP